MFHQIISSIEMKNNIFVIALSCYLLSGCTSEYSAVYQSVDAKSKWDESERIIIEDIAQEPALYLVQENKLYLLIQRTQVDLFFYTAVNYPSWDKSEMNRLINKHDNIKLMLPAEWNNWLPKGYGDECKTNTI